MLSEAHQSSDSAGLHLNEVLRERRVGETESDADCEGSEQRGRGSLQFHLRVSQRQMVVMCQKKAFSPPTVHLE